jgi:AraC-like DNA-binding protein
VTEFGRSSEVQHLEARRSCQDKPCYRPHFHDAFSIGAIDEGSSLFAGTLEGMIRLVAGDVIVIPAGQVHSCNPERGPWRYQMIHMDPDWVSSFPIERRELFRGISVLRQPHVATRVRALGDAIFTDEPREVLEAQVATLLGAISAVSPSRVVADAADPQLAARLQPVMHKLRHDESNPSLSDLSELVGMTSSQLVRAMRRVTGLAPLAWRQNARIVQARHMLREGKPIADTAHELGFADQSHFHRIFRAHVAASPGTYRS